MTSPNTGTQAQVSQTVELIQQHKDQLRTVLGTTSSGTNFGASYRASDSDRQRLQKEISGLNIEQVDSILSVWPVYQMGFEDGQDINSSS